MVIIADTTALIALENAGHFDLLRTVFGQLLITPIVAEEWGMDVPDWIHVEPVKDHHRFVQLKVVVDPGEASSLALALEIPGSTVLTDDRKARLLADRLNVATTGTLAVVLLAKERGHIPFVLPVIEDLKASGFRMSPELVEKVRLLAGEN